MWSILHSIAQHLPRPHNLKIVLQLQVELCCTLRRDVAATLVGIILGIDSISTLIERRLGIPF